MEASYKGLNTNCQIKIGEYRMNRWKDFVMDTAVSIVLLLCLGLAASLLIKLIWTIWGAF